MCVGLIEDAEESYLVVSKEIFSTFFWGDSDRFIATFLPDFVRADNPDVPVELVYLYGGTIHHENVMVATKEGLH